MLEDNLVVDKKNALEVILSNLKYDPSLVSYVIQSIRLNARSAFPVVKGKGDVSVTGKKPWNQKGTGRARAGSFASPIWRSGGIVFGPNGRVYKNKINKKVKKLAFRCVLSYLFMNKRFVVLDSGNFLLNQSNFSTKSVLLSLYKFNAFNSLFDFFNTDTSKEFINKEVKSSFLKHYKRLNILLIVDNDFYCSDRYLFLSKNTSNFHWFNVMTDSNLSLEDIFNSDCVIFTDTSLCSISNKYFAGV